MLRLTAMLAACPKSSSLRMRPRIRSAASTACCPSSASSCSALSPGDSPAVTLKAPGTPICPLISPAVLPAADAAGGGDFDDPEFDGAVPEHPANSTQPITTTGHQRRFTVPAIPWPPSGYPSVDAAPPPLRPLTCVILRGTLRPRGPAPAPGHPT